MTKRQIYERLQGEVNALSCKIVYAENLKDNVFGLGQLLAAIKADLDAEPNAEKPAMMNGWGVPPGKLSVLDVGLKMTTPLRMVFDDLPPGSEITLRKGPQS